MQGRLIFLNSVDKFGKVNTGNDNLGILTIYFKELPSNIKVECTVEFDVVISKSGNRYARFIKVVERNDTIYNTENRDLWYTWGENEEKDFITKVVPKINLDIRINPDKEEKPWVIDLYDYTNNRPADLKVQNTPFFTASKYSYNGKAYDPTYSVTFNKKDYINYKEHYPNCDIYFWINWQQTSYRNIRVEKVYGVWRASFSKLAEKIEAGNVVLHKYLHRINDDHNAKESYIFYLKDESVFEKLV